ncbi:uncharacterized protein LOC122368774 [Amphibalanus amphitrite]|uniref:uncharacterized protein LOC122368774 n=1 Tax=Amphibalanus amphitrite TaxID=1232801 RepID=UPI001C920303|nr:uncharacterized protein LOC122368774 [Amphibalanus amphitrite]
MRKITVISVMLMFTTVAKGQSLDICSEDAEEVEVSCPDLYSECDGACYQDTFTTGDDFTTQCTGDGQFLPIPTTEEQLQCLLDVAVDQTRVATGFENRGDRFEAEDPDGTTITAPQELEGTAGPDPNTSPCVALFRNQGKLETFGCFDSPLAFVCQIAAEE